MKFAINCVFTNLNLLNVFLTYFILILNRVGSNVCFKKRMCQVPFGAFVCNDILMSDKPFLKYLQIFDTGQTHQENIYVKKCRVNIAYKATRM